jgi:putative hydrolase of the HAD superfamily
MVDAVVFDLFGTVVATFSRDRHLRTLTLAAEALGLDPARCDAAWDADYDNRVRGRSGALAEQLRAIARSEGVALRRDQLDRVVATYVEFCNEQMMPVQNAAATLEALAERSVPVGLASNTAPDLAAAFDRSSLRPFFTTCTFSCVVGAAKPERAIYFSAAEALGVDPAGLLFVGDGSDDELAGAALAGLTPALLETDTADTYDPARDAVVNWTGIRLRDLSDVLELVIPGQRS